MERVSRRLGLRVVPVLLGDGSQAIDVDDARIHAVVEAMLAGEKEHRPAARTAAPPLANAG
jgi:hypothetical protein